MQIKRIFIIIFLLVPKLCFAQSLENISSLIHTPQELGAWLSRGFRYQGEMPDYWQSARETLDLKTGDWSSKNCKSDYSLFEKIGGACYYYILRPDSGQAEWIKNKSYKNVPQIRFEKPLESLPKDLSFLNG